MHLLFTKDTVCCEVLDEWRWSMFNFKCKSWLTVAPELAFCVLLIKFYWDTVISVHLHHDCSWFGAITTNFTMCGIDHRGAMFSTHVYSGLLVLQGNRDMSNNFFVSSLGGTEDTSSKELWWHLGQGRLCWEGTIQVGLGDALSMGRQEKDSHRKVTELPESGEEELRMGIWVVTEKGKWLWLRPQVKGRAGNWSNKRIGNSSHRLRALTCSL